VAVLSDRLTFRVGEWIVWQTAWVHAHKIALRNQTFQGWTAVRILCGGRLSGEADEVWVRRIELRVHSAGEAGEALKKRWGGGVEVLVRNNVDATLADRAEAVPVALSDDLLEGDAVAYAAPGEEEDVGVGGRDLVRCGVGSGGPEEAAVGGGDEFGDPGLRADERLAPLFAVDEGLGGGGGGIDAGAFEGALHGGDEGLGGLPGVDHGGEEVDVREDVREGVGGEGKDGIAGAEDGGEGLHAVGDAGDEEIGTGGEETGGVRLELVRMGAEGPRVMEDGEVAGGEFGESIDAVAGAGTEVVQAAEGSEGERHGGLEGGDAHC